MLAVRRSPLLELQKLNIIKMKLEERLNEIIEEKDNQIEELQEKIERNELQRDLQKLEYQIHEYFKETELQKSLLIYNYLLI